MSVGFTPEDAKRVAEAVRVVERMPGNTARGGRGANQTPTWRTKLRGKLDSELATTAVKMSVWTHNGSSDVATGEKIDVWPWMLKTDQKIKSGKMVVAEYFPDSNRWYVVCAECD